MCALHVESVLFSEVWQHVSVSKASWATTVDFHVQVLKQAACAATRDTVRSTRLAHPLAASARTVSSATHVPSNVQVLEKMEDHAMAKASVHSRKTMQCAPAHQVSWAMTAALSAQPICMEMFALALASVSRKSMRMEF